MASSHVLLFYELYAKQYIIGNWSKKEAREREVEQCKKFHVTVIR